MVGRGWTPAFAGERCSSVTRARPGRPARDGQPERGGQHQRAPGNDGPVDARGLGAAVIVEADPHLARLQEADQPQGEHRNKEEPNGRRVPAGSVAEEHRADVDGQQDREGEQPEPIFRRLGAALADMLTKAPAPGLQRARRTRRRRAAAGRSRPAIRSWHSGFLPAARRRARSRRTGAAASVAPRRYFEVRNGAIPEYHCIAVI